MHPAMHLHGIYADGCRCNRFLGEEAVLKPGYTELSSGCMSAKKFGACMHATPVSCCAMVGDSV